uniref:F-box domain-containing protein n=1 Tax=Coccidioides posadasii RMSCC 3488 TaxID=454284 RepID=A0A0J6F4D1_COCPO|nr:hypothetical protein CPAG_00462 [Coccidioides posadasii RMSCC 3488]
MDRTWLPSVRTLMDIVDTAMTDPMLIDSDRAGPANPLPPWIEAQTEIPNRANTLANIGASVLQPPTNTVPRDPMAGGFGIQDIPVMEHQAQTAPQVGGDMNMTDAPGALVMSHMQANHHMEIAQHGRRASQGKYEQIFAFVVNPMIFFQVSVRPRVLPAKVAQTLDTLPISILERIFDKLDGASQVCLALTAKVFGRAVRSVNYRRALWYTAVEREQLLCWRLASSIPETLKLCHTCMKYYPTDPQWWGRRKAWRQARTKSQIYGRILADYEFKNVACPECTAEARWTNVMRKHSALQQALGL